MTPEMKAAMKSWYPFTTTLNTFTEAEVKNMLDAEMEQPHPRQSYVGRLHQRYSMLRAKREREMLMARIQEKA